MNQNIWRLGRVFLVSFVGVALALIYWQLWRAPALVAREDNPRRVLAEQGIDRGRLLDREGDVLAYSEVEQPAPTGVGGKVYVRRYPYVGSVHAVGYYSLRYGTGAAEAAFDPILRGQLTPLDQLLHRTQVGQDVGLSVDLLTEEVAGQSMAGYSGAVVVMQIKDGQVWALVSRPTFDPNELNEQWDTLTEDPSAPLLNRGTQGLYAVGDISRWIGATGLLSSGITVPTDPDQAPLTEMLAPLGEEGYLATCRQLGFDRPVPFDLPTVSGLLPDLVGDRETSVRDLAVTPLHLARWMAGVADGGQMPRPGLMLSPAPAQTETAFSDYVAVSLRGMTKAYGNFAGWDGLALPEDTGAGTNSWLVGYWPPDQPQFVLVIVIEACSEGLQVTQPIADAVIHAVGVP